jgi:hypothetical protein
MNRALALWTDAQARPQGGLHDDILRAAWMMGVGACDAYFSDAYADLIARALRAKEMQPEVDIPDRLNNLKVPVVSVIRGVDLGGWRWRMAARELIEDENVLSLEKIKHLFNHFFRDGHKLLTPETIEGWILHADAKTRNFGVSRAHYRALPQNNARYIAKANAVKRLKLRFEGIFQRRHDCIHNCDRPSVAPQRITDVAVAKCIQDVSFVVDRCHEALFAEFQIYLRTLGFNGVTRNRVTN